MRLLAYSGYEPRERERSNAGDTTSDRSACADLVTFPVTPRRDNPSWRSRRMTQPVSTPLFELSNQDAVAWLRALPAASVDLLITDPAYESLEKHRAVGTTTRLKHSKASSNDWFTVFPNARFDELFEQVYRVLRDDTHFYLFCDAETMFEAKPKAERAGFKFWKPLVWDKQTIGMGYHYRARYEFILFFEKGKRRLNDLGIADIINVPRVHRGYPAEKPVGVSDVLVKQSSSPGDVIADPFMGSGSVGEAALMNGRRFLGTDLNAAAVRVTGERLQKFGEGRQPDLGDITTTDLLSLMGTEP
jgi:site-specific DNA-methyltransferase (adenine-specific)